MRGMPWQAHVAGAVVGLLMIIVAGGVLLTGLVAIIAGVIVAFPVAALGLRIRLTACGLRWPFDGSSELFTAALVGAIFGGFCAMIVFWITVLQQHPDTVMSWTVIRPAALVEAAILALAVAVGVSEGVGKARAEHDGAARPTGGLLRRGRSKHPEQDPTPPTDEWDDLQAASRIMGRR